MLHLAGGPLHQVPDGTTADLDRQGLGLETAAAAGAAHRGFRGLFVLLVGDGHPKPVARRAGALLAVEGKKPRVKRLQADAAGRTDAVQAEDLLAAAAVDDADVAAAFVQAAGDEGVEVSGRQASGDEFDGVLVVAGERHARG